MEFLQDLGLFLAQAVIIVGAVLIIISALAGVALRNQRKSSDKGDLIIENLNERFEDTEDLMMEHVLEKKAYKHWSKAQESAKKELEKKANKKEASAEDAKKRLFVLSFDGDVQASETEQLIHTIDAALAVAKAGDEFFCELESPGGLVHSYGLASSQLRRIKDAGFPLTVAIDKVAASGGYMMACVADKIIAAPFSIIGSIGVVAQIPNFNRVLKKHDVDIELHTAGEYKRTLTLFGENTEAAREKFREELEETHVLFKAFVSSNRPIVDVDTVATGEHWYGEQAIGLKLIDEVNTSQTYLMKAVKEFEVYRLSYELKVPFMEKIGLSAAKALTRIMAPLGLKGLS